MSARPARQPVPTSGPEPEPTPPAQLPRRVPPHDLEAEESVLGAMLLTRTAVDAATGLGLEPEDFYDPQHGRLYSAMASMAEDGQSIDPVTLHAWIQGHDDTEPHISRAHLLEIQGATPASANAAAYARTVLEHATRRKLIHAAYRQADMARDLTVPVHDIAATARELIDRADMPVGGDTPSPDVLDFISQRSEHEWAWPGILEVQDRLVLVAGEKAGKSSMGRQIAACLSQGQDPFRFDLIPHALVLVIDLENPPSLVRRKMNDLVYALNTLERPIFRETLRIEARPEGLDLSRRSDVMWLQERVAANRSWWNRNGWSGTPFVLVIGPIYKMLNDELDLKEVRRLQQLLDRIRTRHRCALVLEAHAPHESFHAKAPPRALRPAGPRVWIRWPEFCMAFEESGAVAAADRPVWELYPVGGGMRDERDWPTRLLRRGGPLGWCEDPGY